MTLVIPDLSHYEPDVDFHAVKAGGCPAVITKCSQGTTGVDPTYHDFAARIRSVGLPLGAYHYLLPDDVPGQMDHFLATAALTSGDIRPIIDAEAPGLDGAETREALSILAAKGKRPILYASWAFWRDTLGAPTDHALWLAAYRASVPPTPGATVFAWQFTDRGRCPGVGRPCDCSYLMGRLGDFLLP